MRAFLLKACKPLIAVIVVCLFVILCLSLNRYKKAKKPIALCTALLCIGLILDAGMILLGVPEGPSRVRFVAHGLFTPLLLPIGAYALGWTGKKEKATWAVTAVIMLLGLVYGLDVNLEQVDIAGITRFTESADNSGLIKGLSGLLSFGMVLPLLAAGGVAWKNKKNPLAFLGGFFMFLFSGLGSAPPFKGFMFFVSMVGELLMVLCFHLFEVKDAKTE